MTFVIGGIAAVRPQAIAIVDDSQLVAANNINGVTVGLIGQSKSGPVNTPLFFTNPRDAAQVLVAGELLDALNRAYAPGIVPGAYGIYVLRLDGDPLISGNLALPGVLALQNTTPATCIDLTGAHLGVLDNETAIKIVANGGGGVDITVYYFGGQFSGIGVGAKALSIAYTGAGVTASVTITGSALTATASTVTPTVISGDVLNLPFATYTTLQRLADAINANGAWVATIVGTNPGAPSANLDGATAVSALTVAQFRADLAAQIAWFNTVASAHVTAVKHAGAILPAVAVAKTHLASGRDPVITTNSWAPGLAPLESVNLDILVPISGDAAVHGLVQAHCENMSDPRNKHERRAIVGGAAGETPTQAVTRALAINSAYVQLVYPGLKDPDSNGTLAVIPPYLVAAQKSGISAGLRRGWAATFQYLKAAGIERNCSQSELDTLELGGVMGVEFVTGQGFRVVHDQTTYLKSPHIDRREFSTALVLDQVVARLRRTAELRIGQPASPASKHVIEGDISAECNRMAAEGLLISSNGSPAFQNLSVSIVGTQVTVNIEVAVALPLNFVGIVIVPTSASGLS